MRSCACTRASTTKCELFLGVLVWQGPCAHHSADTNLCTAESPGSKIVLPRSPTRTLLRGTLQTQVEGGSLGPTEAQPHTCPRRQFRARQVAVHPGTCSPSRNACEWPCTLAFTELSHRCCPRGSRAARVPVLLPTRLPAQLSITHMGSWKQFRLVGSRWGINKLQILKKKICAIFIPKMLSMKRQSVC